MFSLTTDLMKLSIAKQHGIDGSVSMRLFHPEEDAQTTNSFRRVPRIDDGLGA